jgi:hypothetical protein
MTLAAEKRICNEVFLRPGHMRAKSVATPSKPKSNFRIELDSTSLAALLCLILALSMMTKAVLER